MFSLKGEVMSVYNEEFYKGQKDSSYESAKGMLNVVKEYLPHINSVIDVGCGVGTWLRAWSDLKCVNNDIHTGGGGNTPLESKMQDSIKKDSREIKIFGIDGNDVDSSLFYIDKKYYKQVDLTQDFKEILKQIEKASGQKKFDLLQSLEVAEHLHAEFAKNFIALLTSLSDIILFSAAIPYQEGTNHFNEQPPSYWANIFKEHDFVCFDFRDKVWENKNIGSWYRQNILLFTHKSKAHLFERLKEVQNPMHLAHYEIFEWRMYELIEARKKIEKLEGFYRRSLRYYFRHPKKILTIFSKKD